LRRISTIEEREDDPPKKQQNRLRELLEEGEEK